jgi:hypothetical protein
MSANFEKWFDDKYSKNQSYGRGVASEAWDASRKSIKICPHHVRNKQCIWGLRGCCADTACNVRQELRNQK